MRTLLLVLGLCGAGLPLRAQWVVQQTGTGSEFRGLRAVSARVVWAAGRGGVVARTTDGGATWSADSIPGAAGLFLIGIHAVDARRAWVLGTAFSDTSKARIFHTADGGRTWQLQYENSTPGIFFDGMVFWDATHGLAFSDPIDGHFVMVRTDDGGAHWRPVAPERISPAAAGEAAFAASGTAITTRGAREVWIGTGGGAVARVFHSADRGDSWEVYPTPAAGGRAKGIFGIVFRDARHGIAVGGDYQQRDASLENLLWSEDGGRSWRAVSSSGLVGVQYGVATAGGEVLVAAGPPGTALSTDGGITWRRLEGPGFNTVSCAQGTCWAAGVGGRIGRLRPVR